MTEALYVPALAHSQHWSLGAMVETRPERRAHWQSILPDVPIYSALDERDVHLDAVVIATPPSSHRDAAVQALHEGLHVLVEKPMGLSVGDGEAMRAAALRSGRHLWVGYNRRFWPSYRQVQRLIDSEAAQTFAMTLHTDPTAWNAASRFLADDAQGGGVLYDLVSHQVDLLCWLTGTEPEAIKAAWGSPDARCLVRWNLRFPNGATARCEAGHGRSTREWLHVQGENGRTITATPQGVLRSRWIPRAGLVVLSTVQARLRTFRRRLRQESPRPYDSHLRVLEAFGQAIQGETTRGAGGAQAEDGLRAHRVLAACRESLASDGAWVTLDRSDAEAES